MTNELDLDLSDEVTIVDERGRPIFDGSWGCNLTYEVIDAVVRERQAKVAEYESWYPSWYPKTEPPTDVNIAKRILAWMTDRELAPPKAWLSWHCVKSLLLADWIWVRVKELGLEVNRGKWT